MLSSPAPAFSALVLLIQRGKRKGVQKVITIPIQWVFCSPKSSMNTPEDSRDTVCFITAGETYSACKFC